MADDGEYYPELSRSTFVQHFMTSQGCTQCEEKYEKEFEARDVE